MKRTIGERGAAAVEFALLVPILLALVFGIVEFGRAYHIQSTLSGAAREGVRVMALTNDAGQAAAAVNAYSPTLGPVNIAATPCPVAGGNTTVTVRQQFSSITGWFPGVPAELIGRGTMRCNG